MVASLNAHRLLRDESDGVGYLYNLNVSERRKKLLAGARDDIRDALREGLRGLESSLVANGLVEQRHLALAAAAPKLRPRFRMQGSAAYFTLNDPAHKPPQQVDYDDGVYLPTSFMNGANNARPIVIAKAYFRAIEHLLEPLCKEKGWKLVKSKSSCVRVQLDREAHIDLPLYAIPDKDFDQLAKALASKQAGNTRANMDQVTLAEEVYRELPADKVMLAHREDGWVPSDPRKMEDWFKAAIDEHGEALRYVCRYLKGWRDYQWEAGCLSSIAIMKCVVTAYDELGGEMVENRDDLALLMAANRLPELLARPIENPVIPNIYLDEDWTTEERKEVVARAERLRECLHKVLHNTLKKDLAIGGLRAQFGLRIPDDETLISITGAEEEVLKYPAIFTPAPKVPRSTSG